MHRIKANCAKLMLPNEPLVRICALIGLLALALGSTHVNADEAAGAALAQKGAPGVLACVACHGAKGEGQAAAGFPRLAGQNQAYLEKQLQNFASGKRANPQMAPIASGLKPEQIKAVAAYYAGLPEWKPATATSPSTPEYKLGEILATKGKWRDGMPACFACHAAGGTGVAPHFPSIAGQPRNYTAAQLLAWQSDLRSNDPQNLMKSVAVKLTKAEIAAVSLYLENPAATGKGE
ncbi:MAG TPA: c-type cytochrome [Thiobacillus sp.]